MSRSTSYTGLRVGIKTISHLSSQREAKEGEENFLICELICLSFSKETFTVGRLHRSRLSKRSVKKRLKRNFVGGK